MGGEESRQMKSKNKLNKELNNPESEHELIEKWK